MYNLLMVNTVTLKVHIGWTINYQCHFHTRYYVAEFLPCRPSASETQDPANIYRPPFDKDYQLNICEKIIIFSIFLDVNKVYFDWVLRLFTKNTAIFCLQAANTWVECGRRVGGREDVLPSVWSGLLIPGARCCTVQSLASTARTEKLVTDYFF